MKPIKLKRGEVIEYLEKMRPEVDKVVKKYLPKKVTRQWLEATFGKPRYVYNQKAAQEALITPLWNFMDRGGKRWRPVLFLLITKAIGGNINNVKELVVIPELIHEGSIIADDIEDQGELRRGKPCLHKIFGTDIALNAANFIYFLPLLAMAKNKKRFKPDVLARAYETYCQEMINLHLGQGMDIYWHKGRTGKISEKEYLQMCAFKTGSLSRLTAKLAVILHNGSRELSEALGRVAEAIGVAFQIQDDILDIVLAGGERKKFGKAVGNDISEGKRTLMVIYALKKAKTKDRQRLTAILNKHTDNISEKKEAMEIIKKYGSVEYAQKVAKKIIADAWQDVDKLLPKSAARAELNEFVNYLIERKI
ncbi:MAG: polyprenyl synthetase family protein [bacterium]